MRDLRCELMFGLDLFHFISQHSLFKTDGYFTPARLGLKNHHPRPKMLAAGEAATLGC
jgi:hypothetical protein